MDHRWVTFSSSQSQITVADHNCTFERRLVVDFCAQPLYCNRPYYLSVRFGPSSMHILSDKSLRGNSKPVSCKSAHSQLSANVANNRPQSIADRFLITKFEHGLLWNTTCTTGCDYNDNSTGSQNDSKWYIKSERTLISLPINNVYSV